MKAVETLVGAARAILLWMLGVGAIVTLGLWLLTILWPSHAEAQAQCAPLDAVEAQLRDRYGEQLLFDGRAANGHAMAVLVNPDGTTWTALVVRPDGIACMMASGTGWAAASPAAPVPPGTEG
ncbi:MAG: hypothetical protein KF887_07035 [Paracoccaceae bacterium]|nr:MAG: hypothetical protein KF887_07035 [Paracoccaceae bacterium]